jgi:hypothetical protein
MTATYVTDCPACCLAGGPFASIAEAEQLAGTHDDLLHRGRPTTVVAADAPEPTTALAVSLLIDGIRGSGKTFALRPALLAAALRPGKGLWVCDLDAGDSHARAETFAAGGEGER